MTTRIPHHPAASPACSPAPEADGQLVARCFEQCRTFALAERMPLFLFGLSLPRAGREPVELIVSNYPPDWVREYDARNFIRIDPVVGRMVGSIQPFAWDELDDAGDPHTATFWKHAARHGLRHGYTVPLHGPCGQRAAFALSGIDQALPAEERDPRFARAWRFAVDLFAQMLREYESPARVDTGQRLTAQQRQTLSLVARGLSVRAIAGALARHPRTVEYHLHGALQRLGTGSREQAIVRALLASEIEVTQLPHKLRDWYRRGRPDG